MSISSPRAPAEQAEGATHAGASRGEGGPAAAAAATAEGARGAASEAVGSAEAVEAVEPSGAEEIDTLVLGAGPAGLAVGACLARARVPFRMIERAAAVGSSWRGHYERLHLHTAGSLSALPFVPFPKAAGTYPSRADVVAYLDAYAQRFGLAPDLGVDVRRVREHDGRWILEGRGPADEARTYVGRRLIICTSHNQTPVRPKFPGEDTFTGEVLHARFYKNGARFAGQRVLVVGAGNTGAEIAIDLYEHGAKPAIALRSPIHVQPRDLAGIPAQAIGIALRHLPLWIGDTLGRITRRLRYADLARYGIGVPAVGPATQVVRHGRIPLIDIGTVALIREGHLEVRPGVERYVEKGVRFVDGEERPYEAVVLATGYRPGLDALLERSERFLDERGYPTARGREVEAPGLSGLYFVGFANPISGTLREIAIEARRVARDIASRRLWR